MRSFGRWVLALALVLAAVSPGLAGVATIEATAPLQDHSEQSIKAAFMLALKLAVQQAEDLGFPWVALNHVQVMEHRVLVQLLATDVDPDSEDEQQGGQHDASGRGVAPPARLNL